MKIVKDFKHGEDEAINKFASEKSLDLINSQLIVTPENITFVYEDDKQLSKQIFDLQEQIANSLKTRNQAIDNYEFAKLRTSDPVDLSKPRGAEDIDWATQKQNNLDIIKTMDRHIVILNNMISDLVRSGKTNISDINVVSDGEVKVVTPELVD